MDLRNIGLDPVVDRSTKAVILGTFPGVRSLEAKAYYADTRNHFWRIMSLVHKDDYLRLPYKIRVNRLLARRIGLWDVYDSCVRRGSMDKEILDLHRTDAARLREIAPSLELVIFNGAKAAKESAAYVAAGLQVCTVPSSSSALTMQIAAKAEAWATVIPHLPPLTLPTPIVPKKPFTQELLRQAIEEGRE
jgi:TDG/mug DNA glycosylase family protein